MRLIILLTLLGVALGEELASSAPSPPAVTPAPTPPPRAPGGAHEASEEQAVTPAPTPPPRAPGGAHEASEDQRLEKTPEQSLETVSDNQAMDSCSSTDQQQSPIALPYGIDGLPRAEAPLHLQYEGWNASAFTRSDEGGALRLEAPKLGSLLVGRSFALAIECELKAFEIFAPAEHVFLPEDVTYKMRPVEMEIQLHHHCAFTSFLREDYEKKKKHVGSLEKEMQRETDQLLKDTKEERDQLSKDVEKERDHIQALKAEWSQDKKDELEKAVAKFQDKTDELQKALAKLKELELADNPEPAIPELAQRISFAKDQAEEAETALKVAESYHRAQMSNLSVVSMMIQTTDEQASGDSRMLDFLGCAAAMARGSQCAESARDWAGPGEWLAAQSASAYHYQGTLTRRPCRGPVDWFVLAARHHVPAADFNKFIARAFGSDAKDRARVRPTQRQNQDTEVTVVEVSGFKLDRPRYSFAEKAERQKRFVGIIGGILAFGLAVHTFGLLLQLTNPEGAFAISIVVPLVLLLVGAWQGVLRIPSPWNDPAGYGYAEAAQSMRSESMGWLWYDPLIVVFNLAVLAFLGWGISLSAFILNLIGYLDTFNGRLNLGDLLLATGVLPTYMGLYIPLTSKVVSFLMMRTPALFFLCKLVTFGAPIVVTIFLTSWLILPISALLEGSVTCTDGVDWELHVTFAFVAVWHSWVWGCLRGEVVKNKTFYDRAATYVFFILSILDMYTDAVFVCIAWTCGSDLGMYSLVLYIVGVLIFQQGPVLCQCYTSVAGDENTSGFAMMWCLMLYPAELLKPGAYEAVGKRMEIHQVNRMILIQAVTRCLAEDLPQCALQYYFTVTVKRNDLIMFSIGTSVLSSLFGVGKAVYNYV